MSVFVADELVDSAGLLPRWFGDYVLLKRLGKGGMGQVFLARLPGIEGIDRFCIIKTLRGHFTNDREYVARFIDEARVVVHLHHKNICSVFDVGEVQGTYYLAMDFVAGRDLQSLLVASSEQGKALSVDVALFIIAEVAEALDAAHRLRGLDDVPLNLVHRDVSPHNVLVGFDGDVKLIDFGLAKSSLKKEQTDAGVVLGKLSYMSPEQARGEDVDRRADVFAAGVLLYELVTGERYWHGMTQQEIWSLIGTGTHQPRLLASLDETVCAIIAAATHGDLSQRTATAADLKKAIVKAQMARGVIAQSSDVRDVIDTLFVGIDVAERKERASLLKLAAPAKAIANEPTRIAAAPTAMRSSLSPTEHTESVVLLSRPVDAEPPEQSSVRTLEVAVPAIDTSLATELDDNEPPSEADTNATARVPIALAVPPLPAPRTSSWPKAVAAAVAVVVIIGAVVVKQRAKDRHVTPPPVTAISEPVAPPPVVDPIVLSPPPDVVEPEPEPLPPPPPPVDVVIVKKPPRPAPPPPSPPPWQDDDSEVAKNLRSLAMNCQCAAELKLEFDESRAKWTRSERRSFGRRALQCVNRCKK